MARIVSVRALKARQHSNPERRQALAISKAVAIEALEVRRLFNTFVVTNTGDNAGINPAPNAGTGTLRQAIVDSNAATAATNTIHFTIPTSDPKFSGGVYTIQPAAPLPTITQAVDIDGSSESGFVSAPIIVLNGSSAGGSGLTIQASNTTVSNLDIGRFRNAGIDISGASHVTITGDFIGTDSTGEAAFGNGTGVLVEKGAQNNNIGGLQGNLISGNSLVGVQIDGTATGPQTSGNTISFNFIGADAAGKKSLQNFNGVVIDKGAQNNTVGGTGPLTLNEISGNVSTNVLIVGTATGPQTSGNIVEGNVIGTDQTGSARLSTGSSAGGVMITGGAQNNTVGGTTAAASNVISGNQGNGVDIAGTATGPQTTGNTVEGNFIGTDGTGEKALGNDQNGVLIESGAQNNTVGGGDTPGQDNVISGNAFAGVEIEGTSSGAQTTGNVVEGNIIGADEKGLISIANGTGVGIALGAQNNTIGGSVSNAQSNVISGNNRDGIDVDGTGSGPQTTGNNIQNNQIGLDSTGQKALPNGGDGILINQGASTTTVNLSNDIAGNIGNGVDIFGGVNNTIAGNDIGNFVDQVVPNGKNGIFLRAGSQNNIIGGTTFDDQNHISGNTGNGVEIDGVSTGPQTSGNTIEGNFIGVDRFGAVAEPNGINGVLIANGAQNNTIGGAVPGSTNFISGNFASGVAITGTNSGPQTTGNTVLGNLIGINKAGGAAIPNGTGIAILSGAQNNTIGGTTGGAVNVISGNTGDGIVVDGQPTGPQTTGNNIKGNFIGTDANAATALGNGADGIRIALGDSSMTIDSNNVISGNVGNGVEISGTNAGPQTSGITVAGNLIGTDISGGKFNGNGNDGVLIDFGAQKNTIGGSKKNVITGNSIGVEIQGTSTGPQTTGNVVQTNFIGTDITGTGFLGNTNSGVQIDGGAQNNTVGGSTAGAGNVISANTIGVDIGGTASGPQTSGNTIAGNLIGTDVTGLLALPNRDGVFILGGASNNTIGGISANLISGNTGDGVEIRGTTTTSPQTTGNIVEGNFIGTNSAGTAALGNGEGVLIDGNAASNTIGGASPGAGNVISGNSFSGVAIFGNVVRGEAPSGNLVQANFIGTDLTGVKPLGNGQDGVAIEAFANSNTIGGSIPSEGNVIAFNGGAGVSIGAIIEAATKNNLVRLNSIFGNTGLGIDLGGDGVTSNAPGVRSGPNDLQNFPVLASAVVKTTAGGTFTTVQGTINSVPNTPLLIDFYSTPTLGPGGSAQGKTYLGSLGVTTDGFGNATFLDELNAAVPGGQFITATASTTQFAPNGDTSEFSPPVQVVQVAPPDTTPPTATLTSDPTIKAKTTAPYAFTITYNDNVAVNAATIPPATVTVIGPNGFSEQATLTSTNLSNGPSVVASYTIPAPSGGFTHDSNGNYKVSVSPNSVADTSGNFLTGGAVGTFAVNIPASTTPHGSLGGSYGPAASVYNLTALGTSDWVHWGRNGNASNFDHDKNGGSQISNVTRIGSGSFGGSTNSSRTVSWTNGTPTSSDSADHGYIYASNALNTGYSFTVAAGTGVHTLYIYLGGYSAGGTLKAHLSDSSATDYSAVFTATGRFTNLVTITYNAASAGQKLTLTYLKTKTIGAASGSVDLIAAWMK